MPVLVQRFYKEVRNPLFQGYELASLNVAGIPAVEMLLVTLHSFLQSHTIPQSEHLSVVFCSNAP